jgi:hypothetical protein
MMRARVGTQLESVARIRNNMLSPSADGGLVSRFGVQSACQPAASGKVVGK